MNQICRTVNGYLLRVFQIFFYIINENDEFEFKERILNENEELFWDELCKTEAMVKYMDNNTYEGRINISKKITKTIGNTKQTNNNINIIGNTKRVLWIFVCKIGFERQELDLETRKLIEASDEILFYKYIINCNL